MLLNLRVGRRSLLTDGKAERVVNITLVSAAKKHFETALETCLSNRKDTDPNHGNLKYTGHRLGPMSGDREEEDNLLEITLSTKCSGYPFLTK